MRRLRRLLLTAMPIGVMVGCVVEAADGGAPGSRPPAGEVDASWSPAPGSPGDRPRDAGSATEAGPTVDPDPDPRTEEPDGSTKVFEPPPPPASGPYPAPGEVLVSEVMFDSTLEEPVSEWLELHSLAKEPRTLSGLTLVDGSGNTHVIGGTTLAIRPGAYVVLARSKAAAVAAKVPAASILYEYGAGLSPSAGVHLSNTTRGGITLRHGDVSVAQATYGGWFAEPGSSIQLATLTAAAGTDKASWCLSTNAWATGSDRGTPGRATDCR